MLTFRQDDQQRRQNAVRDTEEGLIFHVRRHRHHGRDQSRRRDLRGGERYDAVLREKT